MERASIAVPTNCPFQSMSLNPRIPLKLEYDGPSHLPIEVVPLSERGYLPSDDVLQELGFDAVPGFTGWLVRRDEAHPIGHTWLHGERIPVPNFQKIIALHRFAGTVGRTNDDWFLVDDFAIKTKLAVPAPNNDDEFRELAAMFTRVGTMVAA